MPETDLLWLPAHGLSPFSFGFGLHLLMQPWPSPRAGCASVRRLRRGLKSNAVFARVSGAKPRLSFWVEAA
jgi:hypothetical protein